MVDNLELIIPLLQFESEDDFYWLQILQRGKEHEGLGRNSRVVKNYFIHSEEYLQERYDQIKKLCAVFNARACLRLNRRSYKKLSIKFQKKILEQVENNEYSNHNKAYASVVGKFHADPVKKWIIDIDFSDPAGTYREYVRDAIQFCMPNAGEDKVLLELPTKSGWHFITTPFNKHEFAKTLQTQNLEVPEIHKDNPTNLYIT